MAKNLAKIRLDITPIGSHLGNLCLVKTNSAPNPLAFGDGQARTYRTESVAEEDAMRMLPWLSHLRFTGVQDFSLKTAQIRVNSLALAALATSPNQMRFRDRTDPAFIFPWIGEAAFKIGGNSLHLQSQRTAILVPPGEGNYEAGGASRSVVVARLDPVRLQATVNTMFGTRGDQWKMPQWTELRELSLQQGGFSLDAAIRALVAQINSYDAGSSFLHLSGIDDVFYRTLALTLYPEKLLEQAKRSSATVSQRHVSRVCEYVMANLSRTITLTELERLAHMSRRALHNAFYKAYNQSPMEWVREQRLLAARTLLHKPKGIQTVRQVLYACGFTNPSLFASQYARRFGEFPSVTLRRSLGGSVAA